MKFTAIGALLLLGSVGAGAQIKVTSSPGFIAVSVQGEPVSFIGTGPQRVGGRIMVPLRGVMEKIGATVHWDTVTKTVSATKGSNALSLVVGAASATVNGQVVSLDAPALIIEGTTMVPLRFMGEALGAEVVYEAVPATSNARLVGVWYLLDSNEAFVKSTKITFNSNGTFLFQGSTWKSTGTFYYLADHVTLIWSSVDGQPVKPGSMTKALPVTPDAKRLQLDRFLYGKS